MNDKCIWEYTDSKGDRDFYRSDCGSKVWFGWSESPRGQICQDCGKEIEIK